MSFQLTPDERKAIIKQIALEREALRRKAKNCFYSFVKYLWTTIEPETTFVDGWHIYLKAKHFEAVKDFTISKLIVNEPPRHMKSTVGTVLFPAWVWGHYPHRSFIYGSHNQQLSTRDSIKCRQVIESEAYQEVFEPDWKLAGDQNQKTVFTNTRGGTRLAVGVGTGIVGFGGDYLGVDDPIDALQVHSEDVRRNAIDWIDYFFGTRINNPNANAKFLIMQRLHDNDPSGYLMRKDETFQRLILPAEYDPDAKIKSKTSLPYKDPRTKRGELLWPEQWGQTAIDEARIRLGDDASAQLNQNPQSPGGGFFPPEYWKYYDVSPSPILELVLFIDAAQKPGVSNDYSVFALWARTSTGYYLMDLMREKTDGPLLEELTVQFYNKWKPDEVVIEDASAGSSLIQYLLAQTSIPVLPFKPRFKKEVRAAAAKPTIKAGKCFLPKRPIYGTEDGKEVNLVEVFVREHEKFLKAEHDDTVDTTSMLVKHFSTRQQGADQTLVRSLV